MEETVNTIRLTIENKIKVMEQGMLCLRQSNMHNSSTYLYKEAKVAAYKDCLTIIYNAKLHENK